MNKRQKQFKKELTTTGIIIAIFALAIIGIISLINLGKNNTGQLSCEDAKKTAKQGIILASCESELIYYPSTKNYVIEVKE
jgi:uncharacterized protein YpmB